MMIGRKMRREDEDSSPFRDKLKLKPDTVGTRIAKARMMAELTQAQVADKVDRGRSAIAQWERDDSAPDFATIEKLAKLFRTTPQFLAFGVTAEPTVVMPDPETMGFALVDEITFGNKPGEVVPGPKWGASHSMVEG